MPTFSGSLKTPSGRTIATPIRGEYHKDDEFGRIRGEFRTGLLLDPEILAPPFTSLSDHDIMIEIDGVGRLVRSYLSWGQWDGQPRYRFEGQLVPIPTPPDWLGPSMDCLRSVALDEAAELLRVSACEAERVETTHRMLRRLVDNWNEFGTTGGLAERMDAAWRHLEGLGPINYESPEF